MDFQHLVTPLGTLSELASDALLLVIGEAGPGPSLDPLIAALVHDAVKAGDFKLKAGRSLYVHRPAGLRVARLAVVVAADASPKAFKSALGHGFSALKGTGAKHVAVAHAGCDALGDAHAEMLALAAADATYLYRHTKPSAPPAPLLAKFSLVCDKAGTRAVKLGLARGAAIAAGVAVARECANLPANFCTPSHLASEAKKLGRSHGLKVEVLDRKDVEKLGMGAFLAVAQGSAEPLKFIVARYEGAAKSKAPLVLVGKGITFDTGGISIKPAGGMDEMKFDMGGAASVLGTLRAVAEIQGQGEPDRRHRGLREHAQRHRREAGRRGHQHVGPDHRDPEHRCRRPLDPVRCADLCRALQAGGGGRHRHAHRRLRRRAGPPPQRPVQRRRCAGV